MYEKTKESAAYILERMGAAPDVAVVLGSGLGAFAEELEDAIAIPYGDIPHFVVSTAPGHKGQLVAGRLGGKKVLCMQGRFHYFEGYTMQQVTHYVRVFKHLGVPAMLITNAAGGIDESFAPGDLMLITDHINFMGTNPLIGPNDERYGERFVDMTYAYNPALRKKIKQAAENTGIALRQGVYAALTGPSYETPAEIRMLRGLGGSAVGMSTVPEVIEANHCGIPVAGITCISNMAAGILDQRLTSDEVIETGALVRPRMISLLKETIALL